MGLGDGYDLHHAGKLLHLFPQLREGLSHHSYDGAFRTARDVVLEVMVCYAFSNPIDFLLATVFAHYDNHVAPL